MPANPCCCDYCCPSAVLATGSCLFSKLSRFKFTVNSSTAVGGGVGSGDTSALVTWLNAYWAATPTTTLPWNTHQGGPQKCNGQYTGGGIEVGLWVKQIGTLSGTPVWAYSDTVDEGCWHIGFSHSTNPKGIGTPFIVARDDGSGTCDGTTYARTNGVGFTGTINFTIVIENNPDRCDEPP